MSINELPTPKLGSVKITIEGDDLMIMSGTIAIKDPGEALGPFLRSVHEQARGKLTTLRVDVSGLTFVNSSAIRLFVDWATWVKKEPEDRRYLLRFLTDRGTTWQRTSFAALQSLAGGVVAVESVS
jgi:hypothetical protein